MRWKEKTKAERFNLKHLAVATFGVCMSTPVHGVQFCVLVMHYGSELSNFSMQVLHGLLQGSQLLRADTVQALRAAASGRQPSLMLFLGYNLLLRFC